MPVNSETVGDEEVVLMEDNFKDNKLLSIGNDDGGGGGGGSDGGGSDGDMTTAVLTRKKKRRHEYMSLNNFLHSFKTVMGQVQPTVFYEWST